MTTNYLVSWTTKGLKPSDKARFYYALYGRVRKIKVKERMYQHYYEGALHDIPFMKVGKNSIVVAEKCPEMPTEFQDLLETAKFEKAVERKLMETAKNRFKIKFDTIAHLP